MMNPTQQAAAVVQNLLVASIFASPDDHGLTLEELLEAGAIAGLREGELRDALRSTTHSIELSSNGRYGLGSASHILAVFFGQPAPGDPRNLEAFDFVWCQFRELDRDAGAGKGKVDKGVLLHRAVSDGLDEHDVRVAVAIYTLANDLSLHGTTLHSNKASGWGQSPREQLARDAPPRPLPFAGATDSIDTVADIISRRTDGRVSSAEPIRAFPDALESVGLPGLVRWWKSIAAELRVADPQTSPTTIIVLSAALAEAALCSLLERAKATGTSMTKNAFWDKDPKNWKFVMLIKDAKSGQDPIFDDDLGRRAARLNDIRQRIHAGRFWPERPDSGFDLRPEEARESKETLDRILRAALDWLDRQS